MASSPTNVSDPITFSFGRNWKEFLEKHFSEERVQTAQQHLLKFLEMPDLKGKYFLDIGCGSGIHSLAAFESGAARIVSFDVDPFSVESTTRVRESRGNPPNWSILHGSVLDKAFLAPIEPADIVYSWGVLHHTGQMWQAIENAAGLMKPDALFYIALYVTTPKSGYWLDIKKRYNRASPSQKRLMEARYVLRETILYQLAHRKNPFRFIREYPKNRGMDFMTDVRDWLGGYPFEDASVEEVLRFGRKRLGLNMINLTAGAGLAEYLFERRP